MDDDMRDEYTLEELGPGVRGKYYEKYWKSRKAVDDDNDDDAETKEPGEKR